MLNIQDRLEAERLGGQMLQKIRSASLIVAIGSFLTLGINVLLSQLLGLNFPPGQSWVHGVLLLLTQILIVGFFLGIGAFAGVTFDIWTTEKFSFGGKASRSYWFAAGAVIGTVAGIQLLSAIGAS